MKIVTTTDELLAMRDSAGGYVAVIRDAELGSET